MWSKITEQNKQIILNIRKQKKEAKEYLDQVFDQLDMPHHQNSWLGGRITNSELVDAVREHKGSDTAIIIAIQIMKIQECEETWRKLK